MNLDRGENSRAGVNLDPAESTQAETLFKTGVNLIEQKKSIDKAIKCIQRAIRLNDSNYRYWQYLGEAYFLRGSLNPAINCFKKSLDLAELQQDRTQTWEADTIRSRLGMSDIRLSVAHLDEAASGYSEIIEKHPDNVIAILGLSKTELEMSKRRFSSGLVKSGHTHCMKALNLVIRAIQIEPNQCVSWKLASDCCLLQFTRGQRGFFEAKIEQKFPGSPDGPFLIDRVTCIGLAQRFLCKAVEIEDPKRSASLWHNLGLCLYFKSKVSKERDEQVTLLKRSIKCLLKALKHDRNNSLVRNSLGVVAFDLNLPNLGQSFIIKSIQSSFTSAEMQFSNLGYIYLHIGDHTKARVAFERCQAEDPLYSRSWLGISMVNEHLGLDNLSQLRHCHRLGNLYESQLKFASKVVGLPHIDEFKKDVVDALDCMQRIIHYDSRFIEALNILGLIFERCRFFSQAKESFDTAYTFSPNNPKIIFNRLRQQDNLNQGCWFEDGEKIDRSDLIKKAEELARAENRDYALNYIYYLFKNCDFNSVSAELTRLLNKIDQDEFPIKASVQILLGLAASKQEGDSKSWFFKNILDSSSINCIESVINLTCLMLTASAAGDQQVVDNIGDELAKNLMMFCSNTTTKFETLFYSKEGFWLRLALFGSIFSLKVSENLYLKWRL